MQHIIFDPTNQQICFPIQKNASKSVFQSAAAAAAAAAARQKCVTVVKIRTGTLFGHIFAIRKIAKVSNSHQKWNGHTFLAGFRARKVPNVCNSHQKSNGYTFLSCFSGTFFLSRFSDMYVFLQHCNNFGWVRRSH